ncbi:hypothetical protein, partial [Sphingopyxis sp.]|uniref:hypothetical protein n=1 Tax=Sphingopyxis sp. TaxID=1908224 RepID=UPI00257E9BCB
LQDPGPPPTCPFIDNHNFKEPPTRNGGQLSFPAIAIGGHLSVSVGDRVVRGVWRRAPSGEKASRPVIDSRQQPFCNFVSLIAKIAGNAGVFRCSRAFARRTAFWSKPPRTRDRGVESSRRGAKSAAKSGLSAFDSPKISGCLLGTA